MMTERRFRTVDYHTAGEPFRIVLDGVAEIAGADVPARRLTAMGSAELDGIRQLLCHEPRGHADMYGCYLVPPDDDGAHLGTLFWHKDGFSTACGHGTIALGTWAVESGRVPAPDDGETEVVIDVPSGRVRARVRTVGGRVESVAFVNVPSWEMQRAVPVAVDGRQVTVDIAFGGAAYASLPASSLGLTVRPADYQRLIGAGRQIRDALNAAGAARHPSDERLSGIYGTILYDELDVGALPGLPAGSVWQRNVAVFADGQVDRSPCGSGTSARVAALAAAGRLAEGGVLVHDSIVDTRFVARVVEQATAPGGGPAVVPEVVGSAHRTAESEFVVDEADPVTPGFVLR